MMTRIYDNLWRLLCQFVFMTRIACFRVVFSENVNFLRKGVKFFSKMVYFFSNGSQRFQYGNGGFYTTTVLNGAYFAGENEIKTTEY